VSRRFSPTASLIISLIVILAVWTRKVVRNTIYIEEILRLFASIENVLLNSLIMGLFAVLVVTLLLRLSGERYRDLGFTGQRIGRQLAFGVFFGTLIFAFDTFLSTPVVESLLPSTAAPGVDMGTLFSNTRLLPLWILAGLFKGAFSEELWRIFALTRFEKWLGRPGLILALILGSIVFGFGHLYQGLSGLVTITIVGFLYALVYLRRRRVLEAMFAHATFNLISITLGYLMYSGS